ncbi:YhjD/YihY/BrkB family envelope integrity protein [uncultured Propionibacterium sp.]|uniref:YhjD/YihY/BrkB family envelope integrity protein n=1 Tax=uncultured Propionibacterium sp. TaxID=218066 RepID=UPI00292FAFA0|nr:YhjD/YihY/BrkB family envelope integrity protein [uncultured Propionibacterium sp.]
MSRIYHDLPIPAPAREPARGPASRINRFLGWASRNPTAAHLWRANDRFNNRLGNQFAGGITYFSVLAVVPVLMFAFSALGFVLTRIRPAWLAQVKAIITRSIYSGPLRDTILSYVDQYLYNWRAVGLVAIVVALWAGGGWVGNVKSAIRAMWRPEFDMNENKHFFFVEVLINMGQLIGFIVLILLDFVANTVFITWGEDLVRLLPIDALGLSNGLVKLVSAAVSLVSGWILLYAFFTVLPADNKAPRRSVRRGSLMAAVMLWVLQAGAGTLAAMFARNRSAALWGASFVVALLFLNLFARLILYVACWIATANQPAVARRWSDFDQLLRHRDDAVTVPGHWDAADEDHARRMTEEESDPDAAARRNTAHALDTVMGSLMSGLGGPPADATAHRTPIITRRLRRRPRRGASRSPVGLSPAAAGREHRRNDRDRTGGRIPSGWVSGLATGLGAGALLSRLADSLLARRRTRGGA